MYWIDSNAANYNANLNLAHQVGISGWARTTAKRNDKSTFALLITKWLVWKIANPQNLTPGSPGPKLTSFIKRSIIKLTQILWCAQNEKNGLSTAMIRNEQAHDNKRSGRYCFFEGHLQRNIVFWYLSEWISNVNNIKILKDVCSGMARKEICWMIMLHQTS